MMKKHHSEIDVEQMYNKLQNTRISFNLRMTNALKDKVDMLAKCNGMSTNGFICSVLEDTVATPE